MSIDHAEQVGDSYTGQGCTIITLGCAVCRRLYSTVLLTMSERVTDMLVGCNHCHTLTLKHQV